MFTTKVTKLCTNVYGCRVYRDGKVVVEGRAEGRDNIAPTFRDLLRTIDKAGGDSFTNAARDRMNKPGNKNVFVKHIW